MHRTEESSNRGRHQSSARKTLVWVSTLCLYFSQSDSVVCFTTTRTVHPYRRWFSESLTRRRNANVWTNGDSSSQSSSLGGSNETNRLLIPDPTSTKDQDRKMNLMWCDRDKCKDVVRERVVGSHNQIILNGPATGQVAYRWEEKVETKGKGSILLLVKRDKDLFQQAAAIVPLLTEAGIKVLLVPDLAAKLKYNYGVDDEQSKGKIELFEPPSETNAFRRDRHVDDNEEDWVRDLRPMEPFPDLVCTIGGDGLLIYASMLFQGPVPPILSIAGGSLGFLTCFEMEDTVEAIKIALGSQDETTTQQESIRRSQELDVFPPNMPSYPYEPLTSQRPRKPWEGPQARATFGMDGIICMTIRMRLDCRVVNPEGKVRVRYNVLNEVVIDRGSSSYLANLECFCDDVHLTTVQADGIIFAT